MSIDGGHGGNLKFEAFLLNGAPFEIRPAPIEREWMEATAQRYAYRCLPLGIANAHGWEILCPSGFRALWRGGVEKDAIQIETDAGSVVPAVSHFGHGIMTVHISVIFRTEPGYDLMVQGPINRPKDSIYALSGIVETDWAPFTFTMNWIFTRAMSVVRFEQGEPFCHLFPIRRGELEGINPVLRDIEEDPTLKEQFEAWSADRARFITELKTPDSDAAKERWQKYYYRGLDSAGNPASTEGHRTRIRLKPFSRQD